MLNAFVLFTLFLPSWSLDRPILSALFKADFESVRNLIADGCDPNEVDPEYGWTPLQVVAFNGSLELAQLLVDHGARLDDACRDGWTPLIISCREGHFDLAKYFIENGADMFVVSRTALSAFSASVLSGNYELQNYLREVVEQSERGRLYINTQGRLSELLPAAHSGDPYAVKAVIEDGGNANQRSISNAVTPLMLAATVSGVEAMEILLQAGADPDWKDEGGWTALMYAVQYNCVACVQVLLDAKASAHATNNEGLTASHIALQRRDHFLATGIYNIAICTAIIDFNVDNMIALVGVGGDPNVQCEHNHNFTPLILAAKAGSFSALNMLLEYGADPNTAEVDNWTPLMFAAVRDKVSIVDLLLRQGADIFATNSRGYNALDLARLVGKQDIIMRLEIATAAARSASKSIASKRHTQSSADSSGSKSGYSGSDSTHDNTPPRQASGTASRQASPTGHSTDGKLLPETFNLRASRLRMENSAAHATMSKHTNTNTNPVLTAYTGLGKSGDSSNSYNGGGISDDKSRERSGTPTTNFHDHYHNEHSSSRGFRPINLRFQRNVRTASSFYQVDSGYGNGERQGDSLLHSLHGQSEDDIYFADGNAAGAVKTSEEAESYMHYGGSNGKSSLIWQLFGWLLR